MTAELKGHRYLELDSLRGLAALVVVLHHAHLAVSAGNFRGGSLLFALLPGSAAVAMFFVLSGFVLTPPWQRGQRYLSYIAKRFCRLYLPYAAGLLLSVLAASTSLRRHSGNPWIDQTWTDPITLRLVLRHLTGIGIFAPVAFNTAYWTLVIEMRVSLVFPAIAKAVAGTSLRLGLALATSGLVVAGLLVNLSSLDLVSLSILSILQFYMGALLSANFGIVSKAWREQRLSVRIAMIVAAAVSIPLMSSALFWEHTRTGGVVSAVFSFSSLIIVTAVVNERPVQRILHNKILLYLGSRSYSIYLIHGTMLFWVLAHTSRHLRIALPSALVMTFPISEAFHQIIELPAIRLGRFVERRVANTASKA